MSAPPAIDVALAYHRRTMHHPHRYARALGHMDWDTQPDPFRRFDGAPLLSLPRGQRPPGPSLGAALRGPTQPPQALDASLISSLFLDALALSAWKVAGASRWALRVNPSSGNLHPTEAYLICGPAHGLNDAASVSHYAPREHGLEVLLTLSEAQWAALSAGLPEGAVLVALSSIHWREVWKYGERAYRYCQHDVGHALAAVAVSAGLVGWRCEALGAAGDPTLRVLAGLHRQSGPEAEHPDVLLALWPDSAAPAAQLSRWCPPPALLDELRQARWCGVPRALSPSHHSWPIVETVAQACERPDGAAPAPWAAPAAGRVPVVAEVEVADARALICQRRSAVAMDGVSPLSAARFFWLLRSAAAVQGQIPLALPWRPRVDLLLFVHRVQGLDAGLYLCVRDPSRREALREALAGLDDEALWQEALPDAAGLDVILLRRGDVRGLARGVSCGQDIAADGAFAVAMLADTQAMEEEGAWFYRALHWEAGAIGQALYLAAEAVGARGTGIGCFFDDLVHEALGLKGRRFQTFYHFTIGAPVDDARLQTEAAYAHLG